MVYETKFHTITLSKTLLKDEKHLLEYVKLPSNKFSYRSKDRKKVDCVRVYTKNTIVNITVLLVFH